jgi:multidrug resistance efflux pump
MFWSNRIGDSIRRKWLPGLVWVALMATAVYLYWDKQKNGSVVGFASTVEHEISSSRDGRLAYVAVQVGQQVRAGQVIAQLEPADVDAEIAIQNAELQRIQAAIKAAETRTQRQILSSTRGFEQAGEAADVALVKARASYLVKNAELKSVATQRKQMETLLAKKMVVTRDAANLIIRHEALKEEVAATRASIGLLSRHVRSTSSRRNALPENSATIEVEPLRKILPAAQARLNQLLAHKKDLTLRAPVSGRVSLISRHRGSWVKKGLPVAKVVETNMNRVVACISETQALTVQTGTSVTVHPRNVDESRPLTGRIQSLAPSVGEVPVMCRPRPNVPARGRQAMILLDHSLPLVPGQSFAVTLHDKPETSGQAIAAPRAKGKDSPWPMQISKALRKRSRFEPSGLVWVPRLARYVIVSDDTGQKDGDDHAPWLFTMNAFGKVDPEPLRVSGIKAFNDLESIAQGPNGTLYVLASQTFSKKGKRKPARQAFVKLVPEGRGYRAVAVVRLAQLLDAAAPQVRSALGIQDTQSLNIEGMTRYKSGLLLALKAPLDERGRAIVWEMPDPARLFAMERLQSADLKLWAKAELSVQADGKNVPGGIADILVLPNGTIALAATASGIRPKQQTGSLWHAPLPTNGLLQAKRIQAFPGLKPEGLALSPNAGRLAVAFDANREIPSFLERSWPAK